MTILTIRFWTALAIDDAGYGIKGTFGENNTYRYRFQFQAGQFASTDAQLARRRRTANPVHKAGYGVEGTAGTENNASRYRFHFEVGQFASTHAAQDSIVFAIRHLILLYDSPKNERHSCVFAKMRAKVYHANLDATGRDRRCLTSSEHCSHLVENKLQIRILPTIKHPLEELLSAPLVFRSRIFFL